MLKTFEVTEVTNVTNALVHCFCASFRYVSLVSFILVIANSIFCKVRNSYVKPIFHWKLGSQWLPNANEIDTNNMECTWPMQAPMPGDPTQIIFHWLALGV